MAAKQVDEYTKQRLTKRGVIVYTGVDARGSVIEKAVCQATDMAFESLIFLDRAGSTLAFASPFIAALAIRNSIRELRSFMDLGDNSGTLRSPVRMLGWSEHTLTTAWNRIVNIGDSDVFDRDSVTEMTNQIKSRSRVTEHGKFLNALEQAFIESGFTCNKALESTLAVPLFLASDNGKQARLELSDLMRTAAVFEGQWGWHGKGLRLPAKTVTNRRRARHNPSYCVKCESPSGVVSFWPDIPGLSEATTTFNKIYYERSERNNVEAEKCITKKKPNMGEFTPYRAVLFSDGGRLVLYKTEHEETAQALLDSKKEKRRCGSVSSHRVLTGLSRPKPEKKQKTSSSSPNDESSSISSSSDVSDD